MSSFVEHKCRHFAVLIIESMKRSTTGETPKDELNDDQKESHAQGLRMLARIIAKAHLVNTGSRVSGVDIQGDLCFPKVASLQDGEQD